MAELLGSPARASELMEAGLDVLGEARGPLRVVSGRLELARAQLGARFADLAAIRTYALRACTNLVDQGTSAELLEAVRLLAQGSSRSKEIEDHVSAIRVAADRLEAHGKEKSAARALFEAGGMRLNAGDETGATILLQKAARLVSDAPYVNTEAGPYELMAMLPSAVEQG